VRRRAAEFILLSDTLGVSMVVDLITIASRKAPRSRPCSVHSPRRRARNGAGGNIAPHDGRGTPMLIGGGY